MREDGIGAGVAWVDAQRPLQEAPRFVNVAYRERAIESVRGLDRLHIVVIGLPAAGWLGAHALGFGDSDMRGKDRNDCAHHLVLDGKDIIECSVIVLGPAMYPRRRINQLR